MENSVEIRESGDSDLQDVLSVEKAAFGQDEEAELVRALLNDRSAEPLLSLIAYKNDRAVGHILFTAARLIEPQNDTTIAILAPLAVIPDAQKQGIGGKLIDRALWQLSESGVDLVFVLGHPNYYPRFGFSPAEALGFKAPYPIPNEHAGVWMVRALRAKIIGIVSGKVTCADELSRPELWRE